jgi:pimeloyl-ACP methyl ester carboxylesterase
MPLQAELPLHAVTPRLVYLHGFASSPDSSKARFFAELCAAFGVPVERPDLNAPDFSRLTVSRMVRQVETLLASLAGQRVVLAGSSLGGFVAWHVAARAERAGRGVDRLVLLAPALDFDTRLPASVGDVESARWRETGWREVVHYAEGRSVPLHYDIVADARRFDAGRAPVSAPVLVFQGRRDEAVDAGMVEQFAASRPNVDLRLLDDDHQLHASLEVIWEATARFLDLG